VGIKSPWLFWILTTKIPNPQAPDTPPALGTRHPFLSLFHLLFFPSLCPAFVLDKTVGKCSVSCIICTRALCCFYWMQRSSHFTALALPSDATYICIKLHWIANADARLCIHDMTVKKCGSVVGCMDTAWYDFSTVNMQGSCVKIRDFAVLLFGVVRLDGLKLERRCFSYCVSRECVSLYLYGHYGICLLCCLLCICVSRSLVCSLVSISPLGRGRRKRTSYVNILPRSNFENRRRLRSESQNRIPCWAFSLPSLCLCSSP
jgi:hypothetical protein